MHSITCVNSNKNTYIYDIGDEALLEVGNEGVLSDRVEKTGVVHAMTTVQHGAPTPSLRHRLHSLSCNKQTNKIFI